MTSQRPASPHTLAAPISMNTSTHSSTLSHVSNFCWDSDCKKPRGQGASLAPSAVLETEALCRWGLPPFQAPHLSADTTSTAQRLAGSGQAFPSP